MTFNQFDTRQRAFNGYGRLGLPSRLDDDLHIYVDELIRGGPRQVAQAISQVSEQARDVLQAYALRMASLAVRTGERQLLFRALVALTVGGLDRDAREALMVMAPIDNSVRRLNLNAQELFDEAAAIVGQPGSESLALWLARSDEDRSLSAMGYIESQDQDGFRYKLNW